jgi:hypothetical protein
VKIVTDEIRDDGRDGNFSEDEQFESWTGFLQSLEENVGTALHSRSRQCSPTALEFVIP